MSRTLRTLEEARELISNRKSWTTSKFARDAKGWETDPLDGDAFCFCALGALMRVSGTNSVMHVDAEAFRLLNHEAGTPIPHFNDGHTHAEVLEIFDRAIRVRKEVEGGATAAEATAPINAINQPNEDKPASGEEEKLHV